jgi:cyclopropane-fatty-acyl-phospholipid synthase
LCSGVFANATSTLEEGSAAKLDYVCHKLELTPADHLLEIGIGWGSMALHAAR